MSNAQNDILIDDLYEKRAVWLEAYGKKEIDTLSDENGDFIVVEGSDSGHPDDEGYDGGKDKKIYLPSELILEEYGLK